MAGNSKKSEKKKKEAQQGHVWEFSRVVSKPCDEGGTCN